MQRAVYILAVALSSVLISGAALKAVAGDPPRDATLNETGFQRIEDVADAYWFASASRPMRDPDNGNRESRVVSFTISVRHDDAGKGAPRLQSLPKMWVVPIDSRATLDAGSMGFGRPLAFQFGATIAPAAGKTWGDVRSADDLNVQINGKSRK